MAQAKTLLTRIAIFSVSLFWGMFVLGHIFVGMVQNGPRKFFQKKKRDVRPPCLSDPSLGTHSFVRLKDIRLHIVQSGPEDRPLILFIHGFPEFWYSWRHQLREFNKDYRCVAMDMRGYGESDKPKEIQSYHLEHLAEDVRQLVTALGYEKCTVVAHDWGGFVAQYFTALHPNMVERLVLCNIPHPKLLMQTIRHRKQFLMSWYIFFFQLPWLPEAYISSYDYGHIYRRLRNTGDADDIEAYKWSLAQPGGLISPINYYRALFRYELGPLPERRISVPTLMVWGAKDHALSAEMAGMSANYYKDFTLNFVESSGHWVQLEAPKETNANIKKFLLKD